MKEIILESLNHLIQEPDVEQAKRLLDAWSLQAEDHLFKAACHYLIHFVIPSLNGIDCSEKMLPSWVDRVLFHPLEYRPQEVAWADWMGFFGSDTAFVRLDQDGGAILMETLPENQSWAKEHKAGVHFVPFILGKEPTPGHSSRRSKDNAKGALSFMVDFDGNKQEDWKKIVGSPIWPSLVVETERGWHAYWPLNAPCSVSLWERIQVSMNEYFSSDKSIKYASHAMRMPSSWHCKGLFDGREAFYVQLVHATWRRFRLEDLELAFPPKPLPKPYAPREFRPIDGVRLPRTNDLPSGYSHDTLVSESGRVYAGISQENATLARRMLVDWFTGFKQNKKPTDLTEVNRRCDELEIKQFGAVVSR